MGWYDRSPSIHGRLWFPLATGTSLARGDGELSGVPGESPGKHAPSWRLRRPRHDPRPNGRPDTAFRQADGVDVATRNVFGAEPSRPASWLGTLRTHPSPGQWQPSLPARRLDSDRTGLTPAGFQ